MRKIIRFLFCFSFTILYGTCIFAKELTPQSYEKVFGVKELKGERFIADLKYNTPNNFLKKNVYQEFGLDRCYVHPDMHVKLMKLEKILRDKKLKLVLFDCFRPLQVQEQMWKLIPDEKYVADPKKGSNHNRGVAIDCALADESGKLLKFPTEFDDFTEKASHAYKCSDAKACENRELLAAFMEKAGIERFESEWWHYQLPNASTYPIVHVKDVVGKK